MVFEIATAGSMIGVDPLTAISPGFPTVFVGGLPIAAAGIPDTSTHFHDVGTDPTVPTAYFSSPLTGSLTCFVGPPSPDFPLGFPIHRVGDARLCVAADLPTTPPTVVLDPPTSTTSSHLNTTVFCY